MKISFVGKSHAAQHLALGAAYRGIDVVPCGEGELTFVSEDTPTDEEGNRDLKLIREMVEFAKTLGKPVILTSAVPPGFTRSLGFDLWHQAETLRMKDAKYRAVNPEVLIVGGPMPIPDAYREYLDAFKCPVLLMGWEEAEFAKVAINMVLAAQVETTNRLAAAAKSVGAGWGTVSLALKHDKRIGMHSYLEPGRWQDSKHLLRDSVTLAEIERGAR